MLVATLLIDPATGAAARVGGFESG